MRRLRAQPWSRGRSSPQAVPSVRLPPRPVLAPAGAAVQTIPPVCPEGEQQSRGIPRQPLVEQTGAYPASMEVLVAIANCFIGNQLHGQRGSRSRVRSQVTPAGDHGSPAVYQHPQSRQTMATCRALGTEVQSWGAPQQNSRSPTAPSDRIWTRQRAHVRREATPADGPRRRTSCSASRGRSPMPGCS
jgi:hypothetical protein